VARFEGRVVYDVTIIPRPLFEKIYGVSRVCYLFDEISAFPVFRRIISTPLAG
jgi:hypothetical protein